MTVNGLFILKLVTVAAGTAIFLMMIFVAIVSLRENESRAAGKAFWLSLLLPLPYIIAGFFNFAYQPIFASVLLALTLLVTLLLFVPTGGKHPDEDDAPQKRIDERDIMFSRMLLAEGSERFTEYYNRHPDKKKLDDNFRKRPGLLKKESTFYNPYAFAAAKASFVSVASFHQIVEGEPAAERLNPNPGKMSNFIKKWTKKLGAVSVGITELKDYHLYSTIGRGEHYGQSVELNHKFAIALTVEMDKFVLDQAPYAPTVMESAQQYLNSGAIATQLAVFIRELGYPARAHIDANYRVVCPLVARDAGLGEIGRIGLLMTPELGPRVRIAVVTTNLPLVPDKRSRDYSMIEFCAECKKCADVCPSKSISFDDRVVIDGVKRWQINSESCFTYWCTVGTDCARCMSVCPYSHPDNLLHNFIRFGVRNSVLFRKFALIMDDFFYGRKPASSPVPAWMDMGTG